MTDYFTHAPDTAALIEEIRRDKYMKPSDGSWTGTHRRVASAIFKDDKKRQDELIAELASSRACPAGRVFAGAGSNLNVTWWNCFVSPLLQDSMRTDPTQPGKGIMDTLASVAYSMQMGGGVGTDFSPLRPEGALVSKLNSPASGPLPFMDMWDSMCRTVMSAGSRRGAMMATLRCDHPDVMKFITAKRDGSRLRMFNVSVLVTDAFMEAVEKDELWELGHWARPIDPYLAVRKLNDRDWFVYAMLPARQIWQTIMESTYIHAEPGVIFIDQVNRMNNLYYCETIQCCNPCGEQMMANDDNCNLSHINLSRCIKGTPFIDCSIDFKAIERITRLLVRMSDKIIDLSPVPTEEQRAAAQAKRRLGIGITGLANMLMFLKLRYGADSRQTVGTIMRSIRNASYSESIELAKEHGPFPLFDKNKYLASKFVQTLPQEIIDGIAEHGIRNALLNTVAPTGTVSIAQADNSSGGLEPVFAARYKRNVLQPDNSFKESVVEDLGFRVYANVVHNGNMEKALSERLPDYMVTTKDLTPDDHLNVQAIIQIYIDNSVSKTINIPTETSFEDFQSIYIEAYESGCKGCTTYRPAPESGRGAVLTEVSPQTKAPKTVPSSIRSRPDVLPGQTYRLRWSSLPYPMFLTVNDEVTPEGQRVPFEIFLNSKSVDYAQWVTALTRVISAVMRKGGDLSFLPEELKSVWSARGGEFIDQKFVPSEVALIGLTLEKHFKEIGYIATDLEPPATDQEIQMTGASYAELGIGEECPNCGALQVVREEACKRCIACNWSNCG